MEQKPEWIEIQVRVEKKYADAVANFLIEQGSTGIAEENLREQRAGRIATLKAYMGSDSAVTEVVAGLKKYLCSLYALEGSDSAAPEIIVNRIPDEDWNKKWKSFFQPIQVTERIVIKPSWQQYWKKQGELIVELDPGMAFGTGTHPSTRMCLRALDELAATSLSPGDERLLDVGTGSGILAIAAVLLGYGKVEAIDIDQQAVACAKKNAENNNVSDRISFSAVPIKKVDGTFSMIVANILPHVLIHIREELEGHLDDKGLLILSGILTEKAGEVTAAFSPYLNFYKQLFEEEWACLVFQKK